MLPINLAAGHSNHVGSGPTVDSALAQEAPPSIQRERSIQDACTTARAALLRLSFTAPVYGPEGTVVGIDGKFCAPLVRALELWEDWADGARSPAVSHALTSSSSAIATRLFAALYDDLIVDRPALRSTVEANMRTNPVLNRFLSGRNESGAQNDVQAAIRHATQNGHYLELAATVIAPALEAACASVLQPSGTFIDKVQFRNECERENAEKLDELTRETRLLPAQHSPDGHPLSVDALERERQLTLAAIKSAKKQLIPRDSLQGQALFDLADRDIAKPENRYVLRTLADCRRETVEEPGNLRAPGKESLLALNARQHAAHTVGLRLLLDRVVPRQADAAALAPNALLYGADAGTIAMIHEAIATTIAKTVSTLPHYSERMANLMPFAQGMGQLRSVAEPHRSLIGEMGNTIRAAGPSVPASPKPSQPTLLFRAPRSASSFALEWQPDRQAVNVLHTRHVADR